MENTTVVKTTSIILPYNYYWIYVGCRGRATSQPKLLHFYSVFWKNCPNNRLAPFFEIGVTPFCEILDPRPFRFSNHFVQKIWGLEDFTNWLLLSVRDSLSMFWIAGLEVCSTKTFYKFIRNLENNFKR